MSLPSPVLVVSVVSETALRVDVTPADSNPVNVYVRQSGFPTDRLVTTVTSAGPVDIPDLEPNSGWTVWAVSTDGVNYSLPTMTNTSLATGDSLYAAIQRLWSSTPSLLTYGGPLYTSEVPDVDPDDERLQFPFTYCEVGRSSYLWTTESGFVEMNTVNFVAYAKGAENARLASDALLNSFGWQPLPFVSPDLQCVKVEPVDQKLDSQITRARDGSVIFHTAMSFDVWTERQLPSTLRNS